MKAKTQTWGPATLSEFDGVRFLHLDSIWVQGAMRIRKPEQLELEYIQRMCAWMLWRDAVALGEGHAVQLGLGAGGADALLPWPAEDEDHGGRDQPRGHRRLPAVVSACRATTRG